MDTVIGKDGKGAVLTLTGRSTNLILMEKLKNGKDSKALAKVAVRLLFPFKGFGLQTITTDNGSEFRAHDIIPGKLNAKVYFADSYASRQKGAIENADKLIRQYIPKGTDFNSVSDSFIRKVQAKINERPRAKPDFSSPKVEFYKH